MGLPSQFVNTLAEDSARQVLITFGAVVGSLGSDWDFRPVLSELSIPTLVIHGSADASFR
jgi:hypothetical protein